MCKITLAKIREREAFPIRRIVSVKVEDSVKELVTKAEIKLPRKLYFAKNLDKLIQTGDPVKIELGYDSEKKLVTEFEGYVVKISPDSELTLFCEDEMWQLKKLKAHKVMYNTNLPALLKYMLPTYEIATANFELGDVQMKNTTVLAMLEKLKSEYNIYSFFDGKKLVSGKHYSYRKQVGKIQLGRYQLPTSLQYQNKDELRVKIKAQSILSNGSKIEVEVGDSDGAENKLIYSNIQSTEALKAYANEDLSKLKRGGFSGDFTFFGFPCFRAGMKVELSDVFFPERNGKYHIDAVSVEFGASGYFRKITLGLQL